VTSDPPSSSGRFAVQVAAAQSRAEADALVRRLAEAGHEAFVVPVTVGTVEHFRVRVGPFDSEDAAGERARALTRNGFPGAWVSR
jgi:cell division septation protein DedD